jgi:hypothetical protein
MKNTPPFFDTQSNGEYSAGFAAPTAQSTNGIPPPGGPKLKNAKQSTVQRTEIKSLNGAVLRYGNEIIF